MSLEPFRKLIVPEKIEDNNKNRVLYVGEKKKKKKGVA